MIDYGVSGNDRKRLVKVLEKIIGERAIYCGMPTMAFQVGAYTISKSGEITGGELSEEIKDGLSRAGFEPLSEEVDPEPVGIDISIPRDTISDQTIENFENMTASKAVIIKGMFGLSDLPIEVEDDTVRILWFRDKAMSEEETRLASDLVEAMFRKRFGKPNCCARSALFRKRHTE